LDFSFTIIPANQAMNPLTRTISEKLPEQKNTRALITDQHLRVKGAPMSTVYAIGDCSTVENPKLVQQLLKFFADADIDKNGYLDTEEFERLAKNISKKYPLTAAHLKKAEKLFTEYDKDNNGK
jgi:NADH:ubiquinone reductase (H+-translocating)